MSNSGIRGAGRNKKTWTNEKDTKLIDALLEVHASGKYRGVDNGFQPGFLKAVEKLLDISLLDSGIKAKPHIKSRMKTLKLNFSIVHDMKNTSGFGWDTNKCCVIVTDDVWDEYIKTHKSAASFRSKPLQFYDKLAIIFGKDRAIGSRATDLGDEEFIEERPMSPPTDFESFHVDMSEGATSSVSSKRKRTKSIDFDDTIKECSKVISKQIKDSLQGFDDRINMVNDERTNKALALMDKVKKEVQKLPRLTVSQRVKVMHVIGRDELSAHIFLGLDENGKICYVQMLGDGPIA